MAPTAFRPPLRPSTDLILRSEAIARRETGVLPNALWPRVSKDAPEHSAHSARAGASFEAPSGRLRTRGWAGSHHRRLFNNLCLDLTAQSRAAGVSPDDRFSMALGNRRREPASFKLAANDANPDYGTSGRHHVHPCRDAAIFVKTWRTARSRTPAPGTSWPRLTRPSARAPAPRFKVLKGKGLCAPMIDRGAAPRGWPGPARPRRRRQATVSLGSFSVSSGAIFAV